MTDLAERLEAADAAQQAGAAPRKTIAQLIEAQRPQIERALPNAVSPDRLVRVALTTLRTTPKLAECTPESFLGALMLSAQLGLEPGPLGHAYFVPRWNKRLKASEVTFLLGYRGLIDLARRSEKITSIEAHEVYEHDEFDLRYGTDAFLHHRPNLRRRQGDPWAYYGVAKFAGGGSYFLAMNRDDIEERRRRSSASDRGPWVTDYDAMARKTVIRAMAPFLPLTVHAQQAINQDETVHTTWSPDMAEQVPPVEAIEAEAAAAADGAGAGDGPSGEAVVPGHGDTDGGEG